MKNDDKSMENLIKIAIYFSKQLDLDPETDFNHHHQRRRVPKKLI